MSRVRTTTIVTDLGFGDAGKGGMVDYLTRSREAGLVVRFNGGSQAAHNVVTADGRHHAFHQFGSGSFVPGVRTHLSRFMLINPLLLTYEASDLQKLGVTGLYELLTIDREALVITPYHQAANRLRELARGYDRHGTCGHGVGETMADALTHPQGALQVGNLASPTTTLRILESTRQRKLNELAGIIAGLRNDPRAAHDLETLHDTKLSGEVCAFYQAFARHVTIVDAEYLGELMGTTEHTVFEGAQGVLLDEWRGFHPYTTWSTTTFANADQLISEAGFNGTVWHLGLLRAYATRHGAGPFVTEDPLLTAAIPDYHNENGGWQGTFRVGHFDLVTARYALKVAGSTDALAITCLDRLAQMPRPWRVCTSYRRGDQVIDRLVPGPYMDLDYQTTLTGQLCNTTPHYDEVSGDESDYVKYLETHLGLPIIFGSHGVTAQDKCDFVTLLQG